MDFGVLLHRFYRRGDRAHIEMKIHKRTLFFVKSI